MAEFLRLPRMSDTMEEGVIASIAIKVGDTLNPGDLIGEVETDKAAMDWESDQEGVVLHIIAGEGDAIPVNGRVAILGEEGESFEDLLFSIDDESDTIRSNSIRSYKSTKDESNLNMNMNIDFMSIENHVTMINNNFINEISSNERGELFSSLFKHCFIN